MLRADNDVQLAAVRKIDEHRVALGLPRTVFVTADDALLNAAQTEGLPGDNPNRPP